MHWWRSAVIYRLPVRSFADSDGDGVGDLDGVRSRLGYLELLGVDALWLTRSPAAPDPVDPRAVDPALGDLTAFDALVTDAHDRGLRVLVDLVANHTSDEHAWFRAARAAASGGPERARYHFRPGGATPPNTWRDATGGPAWTRLPDGQWYLHLAGPGRPDLNWTNPEVWADTEATLRFWLDRGVDGFHIAAADGMSKPDGLPGADPPLDHDGVHAVHRMIRAVLDHHPGRVAAGTVAVTDEARFAAYLRPDELHLCPHPALGSAPFDADAIRSAVEVALAAHAAVGAVPAWSAAGPDPHPAGPDRARSLALVALALPGPVFLDAGDELGLPRAAGDGDPVPLPWEGGPPGYGFTAGEPWRPMPADLAALCAAAQLEDTTSTLSFHRCALDLRRAHPGFQGEAVEWFGAPPGCLAFRRSGSTLVCALNTSAVAVPLPPGDVLLASGSTADGELAPGTAAWLV